MVSNPDGLAPTLSWDAQPPRAYGGRHSKTSRAANPILESFEKHQGACPLRQRAGPSLILTPGVRRAVSKQRMK